MEYLLREWVRLYHHQSAGKYSEKAFQAFVPQLHQYGILKTDELITRFFKYCTEICVDLTYRALQDYVSVLLDQIPFFFFFFHLSCIKKKWLISLLNLWSFSPIFPCKTDLLEK